MRPERLLWVGVLCAAACSSPPPVVPSEDGGVIVDAGTQPEADGGVAPPLATSSKAALRFKRSTRLANDFAQALGLPVAELCKELGQYSCTEVVHPLALGGVDPYGIGLYEPLPFTGVTSPIVIDRVALYACGKRVEQDLAAPASAVLFRGVVPDAQGKLSPDAPAVRTAVDTLYKRALLRPSTPSELAHLQQLYRDIEAKPAAGASAGRTWMQLSCFTVLTSVESLFY